MPNARLCNLRKKTLHHNLCLVHIPKVKHLAADGVSRHPLSRAKMMTLRDDMSAIHLDNSTTTSPYTPTLIPCWFRHT